MPRRCIKETQTSREEFLAKKNFEKQVALAFEELINSQETHDDETFSLDKFGIIAVILLGGCLKLCLLPAYRSTDFEVHRNWLAITHTLPIEQWYQTNISEWTLDYPPLFAWYEYALSFLANKFDPSMLILDNLNYASNETVIFQRLSVIVSELVLFLAMLATAVPKGSRDSRSTLLVLAVFNAGLLITDHVHFQYNGLLLGILVLSVASIQRGADLLGGILFAILINMKHLYLVLAPAYFVLLLRHHCVAPAPRCWLGGRGVARGVARLAMLGGAVALVFVARHASDRLVAPDSRYAPGPFREPFRRDNGDGVNGQQQQIQNNNLYICAAVSGRCCMWAGLNWACR